MEHQAALDELFTPALGLLSAEGLVTLQRVMHDGTQVKACAGADTFRREEKIRAHLEMARQQVEAMGDPRNEELSQRVAKARERAAREKRPRLEGAEKELEKLRSTKARAEAPPEARVSETDPEARVMKQSGGGFAPSYNVPILTDAAQRIIVGVGISPSLSDQGELGPAVDQVEENTGRPPAQAVAWPSLERHFSALSPSTRLLATALQMASPIPSSRASSGVSFTSQAKSRYPCHFSN